MGFWPQRVFGLKKACKMMYHRTTVYERNASDSTR